MLIAEDRNLSSDINPSKDYIYPKSFLGNFIIHMKKITSARKGSAPVLEFVIDSKSDKWTLCQPCKSWGKKDKTYKYFEPMVQGSRIIFGITNELDDITYYKIEGEHPYDLALYKTKDEIEFLKRFVFFKFTATAAKDLFRFERKINNDIYALDTMTKLLYAYSVPSNYEKMIGNNYIPMNWEPYEISNKTKNKALKFYEYDPVGFVSEDYSYEFFNVKTNIHTYDWWIKTITAGEKLSEVNKLRFMPRVSAQAEKDWKIRDDKIPVCSPYRKKDSLKQDSNN